MPGSLRHKWLDIALLGMVLLLAALFILESDDCYFAYWRFDSLRSFLLTQPDTEHARIVSVPQNGRYLGNLLGVILAKLFESPLFPVRILYYSGGLLILAAACGASVGTNRTQWEYAFLALSLLLLAPRGIWQEVYSWGAAYVNYVTPLALAAALQAWVLRPSDAHVLRRSAGAAVLGFLCCLFMEPVTIFLVLASSLTLLDTLRRRRRPAPPHWAVWIGSILGAAVMFSAPGYHAVGSDGLREMGLDLVLGNFSTILVGTLFRPAVLALLITWLLLRHLCLQQSPYWGLCALAALPLHLAALWGGVRDLMDPGEYVQIPSPTPVQIWTSIGLAALWLTMLLLWKGGTARLRVFRLVIALCLLSGPLLIVSINGNRCFFPGYAVLVFTALTLYDSARNSGMKPLALPRVLALLAACALIFIYGCNCFVFHQRLALGRETASKGAESVTLPLLPFAGFSRNEQPWKGDVSYLIYRETPWDVSFTFIPYQQWMDADGADHS